MTWSERIPAALEKAGGFLEIGREGYPAPYLYQQILADGRNIAITAGEVALAKALWEFWRDEYEGVAGPIGEPPDALRAFVEKVEAL